MKVYKICYEYFNTNYQTGYWDLASAIICERDEESALIYFYQEVNDPSVKVNHVFEVGNQKEIIWAF